MTAQQPEALQLADEAWNFDGEPYGTAKKANGAMMGLLQDCSTELRRLHARVAILETQLIGMDSRRADEKLRADKMSKQHDTQAALNRDARNQLAQMTTQQQPAPRRFFFGLK